MEKDQLKRYYNRCSDEPLAPEDGRYVDIDGMEGRPRGNSWVERLEKQLDLSIPPLTILVSGLRGTGKSTELLKLERRLGRRDGANQLVVLIDAESEIDLANEIDAPDILTSIVNATERKVLEIEGKDPDDALKDGYLDRLWTWLTQTDVTLNKLSIVPGQLNVEMKSRPKVRQRIRDALSEHFNRFSDGVREEMQGLEEKAKRAGFQRITVIFDSLERLHGLRANWKDVLASAERLFRDGAPRLQLPVHVVYTVPPALLSRLSDDILFLPMIKLFDRAGDRHLAGFAAMREIVDRRLPESALKEVLGNAYEPRIDQIMAFSGGHPRLVIKMLQWLLLLQSLPAQERDIQLLFAEQRERYLRVITRQDMNWLRRIRDGKSLTVDDSNHLEDVDRLLINNVILRYANSDVWYDLHPSLHDLEVLTQGSGNA